MRTSHYPPHPRFLELCDELGFWVIDECDFETHGFWRFGWQGNPTDDPAWREALEDRARRMVLRDRHHPSVIMWSLGNEAGVGRNLGAMASAIRELDSTRPLHYEGDRSCEHTDVYSRMYAPHAEVARIGQTTKLPVHPLRVRPRDGQRARWPGRVPEPVRDLRAMPGRVHLGVDRSRLRLGAGLPLRRRLR